MKDIILSFVTKYDKKMRKSSKGYYLHMFVFRDCFY